MTMQHQYWVTKHTVLKKLGSKEDDCIVSSDAELDAKLELFQSISESCNNLQRILDQYQERVCVLSQEENILGKFLRDSSKNADAASKHMVAAGKAISYCSQQRLTMRNPLVRLYNEVDTFRGRAVSDMKITVSDMEKARNEYRAALSWMKSASSQLDPDTGRGLDKFRKAQRQVRESKKIFDKLTLDVLQKIDLLAAARCNLFSHALVSYQSTFHSFTTKVHETLNGTAKSMTTIPQYEFCILKELSQVREPEEFKSPTDMSDKDKMLFFHGEYKDENVDFPEEEKVVENSATSETNEVNNPMNLIDTDDLNVNDGSGVSDLQGLSFDGSVYNQFLPSHLLQNNVQSLLDQNNIEQTVSLINQKPNNSVKKDNDMTAWFKIFAELDPLANPDSLPGCRSDQNHQA